MSVYIEGIGTQKIDYRDHNEVEFSDLSSYILMAKKAISKFANRFYKGLSAKMLKDEDAISSIANSIMMADWRFEENYSKREGMQKTRYSYRNQCAIWAIQSYITKNYKSSNKAYKVYSLDHQTTDDQETTQYSFICDLKTKNPQIAVLEKEERDSNAAIVDEILSSGLITERQREYFRLYYIDNFTYDQIGKKYSLTREAIRQSIKKAISKIQECYNG